MEMIPSKLTHLRVLFRDKFEKFKRIKKDKDKDIDYKLRIFVIVITNNNK